MTTNKKMVPLRDLVPPFQAGEWIYAVTPVGVEAIGRNVCRAKTTPVFVGEKKCSSGWLVGDLDSSHFRHATRSDIQKTILRLEKRREKVERDIADLDMALGEMDRDGTR